MAGASMAGFCQCPSSWLTEGRLLAVSSRGLSPSYKGTNPIGEPHLRTLI